MKPESNAEQLWSVDIYVGTYFTSISSGCMDNFLAFHVDVWIIQ